MVEGKPYVVVDFQHVKPGKGNQFSRTKLRNLLTGQNLEVTFKSGEKFEVPNVENKEMISKQLMEKRKQELKERLEKIAAMKEKGYLIGWG